MKTQLFLLLCVIGPIFGAPIGSSEYNIRELSEQEKDFVWHCFRYHQLEVLENTISYQPCRYLTFDRPTELLLAPNEAIFNMLQYWSHLEGETYRQLAYLAMEHINETRVMDCMLRSKGKSGSLCKIISDSQVKISALTQYSLGYRETLATMRMLFMDESVRTRVEDCYLHHREDRWIGCHLISWDQEFGHPVFADHSQIWQELESRAKQTGKVEKKWYNIEREFEGEF